MKRILSFAIPSSTPETKPTPPLTPGVPKSGHARKPSKDKISDEEYETREKRISNIVAMSKVGDILNTSFRCCSSA